MNRKAIITAISLAAVFSQAAPAQQGPATAPRFDNSSAAPVLDADTSARLNAIDGMIRDRMNTLKIPAYCITVIMNGRVLMHKPYGYANLSNGQPAQNNTVFGLASLTKTFTALTLLSLVDKGLIGLDDPLEKYIGKLTPAYRTLTIRQLASMTAGVPSKVEKEVFWNEQLEILDHTPLESQPGTAFLYSNFSYRLLGSVIESVTGRPFFEVLRETVLAPFQMNSTATTALLQESGRLAKPYGDDMGRGPLREIEYKDPRISFSAGMLASTSDDLVNYVFGLMNRRVLSEKGFKTLWYERPPLRGGAPSKWAFGWAAMKSPAYGNQYSVSMNGGTPGVASTIIILPEANSAVIALSNLRKPPVYELAKTAARIAFGNPNQDGSDEPGPVESGAD
ncbi:MAG: beta-lactamase family protein [Candidatus Obscuribacterales bacterium]|nr:beta-lactamase family protein [Candidatus Obscuribacterales bacterium]